MTTKTRFAPSPTGEIHLGNLRTALFNQLFAAGQGGTFLLRIEDTDRERSKPEFVQALMEDLRWLGLDWQEGPESGGVAGPYFQAERLAVYLEYYDRLGQAGATYPCFCSDAQLKLARKAQRAAGQPPRYPGTCAHLSAEEVAQKLAEGGKPTLRFSVPQGQLIEFEDAVRGAQRFNSDEIGDFIIRRSDGTPAFFFTNAIDDALMGVTHVLRGEDHLTNTPRQLMILAALELAAPTYGHLSLLVGADGSPLSKRHGSRSVRTLRNAGYLPGAILNYLARLGHTYESDRYLGAADLAEGFSLQRLGRAPARYDEAQLRYWQKEALAGNTIADLVSWFSRSDAFTGFPADWNDERIESFIEVVRENIEMPADIAGWLQRLSGDTVEMGVEEAAVLSSAGGDFFRAALDQLEGQPGDFRTFTKAVGKAAGVKGKGLFMPLRVALTGAAHGPEMARVWDWLGTDSCKRRLRAALNHCNNGTEPHAETV